MARSTLRGVFYLRNAVPYGDLAVPVADRGIEIDHVALGCWATKFASLTVQQVCS